MTTSSTPPAVTHRKGVLFCPRCDHTSPIDGDWAVDVRPTRDVYECPDCGATVVSRRRFEALCC